MRNLPGLTESHVIRMVTKPVRICTRKSGTLLVGVKYIITHLAMPSSSSKSGSDPLVSYGRSQGIHKVQNTEGQKTKWYLNMAVVVVPSTGEFYYVPGGNSVGSVSLLLAMSGGSAPVGAGAGLWRVQESNSNRKP